MIEDASGSTFLARRRRRFSFRCGGRLELYRGQDLFQLGKNPLPVNRLDPFHTSIGFRSKPEGKLVAGSIAESVIVLCVGLAGRGCSRIFNFTEFNVANFYLSSRIFPFDVSLAIGEDVSVTPFDSGKANCVHASDVMRGFTLRLTNADLKSVPG